MATGTGGGYWKARRLPGTFKHKLLSTYIPPFGGMTGSVGDRRVVYLDGYAGEGRYESGEPASAEIALQVARDHLARGLRWTCFFSEQDRESTARLTDVVTEYRSQGVDACLWPEDVDGLLDHVLQVAERLPLFLFLDPCGLGLPFNRLVDVLRRRCSQSWPPTEFLLNFSLEAVRRIGGNEASSRGPEASSQRMDEACGGRWWREYYSAGYSPEAAQHVAAEFGRRLHEASGMTVVSVPVRRAPHHQPVYHLVFGTRSTHGLWVFGDAVAKAHNAWWEHAVNESRGADPGALMTAVELVRPDWEALKQRAVPEIAANIERELAQGRSFTLVDRTLKVFGSYYGQVPDTVVRAAVKQLHQQGKTPSDGKGRKVYALTVHPPHRAA